MQKMNKEMIVKRIYILQQLINKETNVIVRNIYLENLKNIQNNSLL